MIMLEMNKCPICGNKPTVYTHVDVEGNTEYSILCNRCRIHTFKEKDVVTAIEEWNRIPQNELVWKPWDKIYPEKRGHYWVETGNGCITIESYIPGNDIFDNLRARNIAGPIKQPVRE